MKHFIMIHNKRRVLIVSLLKNILIAYRRNKCSSIPKTVYARTIVDSGWGRVKKNTTKATMHFDSRKHTFEATK